jgi:3',5'-cyclic AMP phosphodiesterase CpdA
MFNVLARLTAPYANYQRAFGPDLEPRFESAEFLVIGVNTTRPYRRKDGEVSAEQVQRVKKSLLGARGEQIRIVVTHQPVHVIRRQDEANLLHGSELAVREWSAAGADLIMGGHIHLPYVRPLSDRFTDLPRRTWVVQAGTAISHRVRHEAPNSINIVRRVSGGQLSCVVERWDYQAAAGQFELAQSDMLELDRRT